VAPRLSELHRSQYIVNDRGVRLVIDFIGVNESAVDVEDYCAHG
jgi:hypothetical protein